MMENQQAYDGLEDAEFDDYESVETNLSEAMGIADADDSDHVDEDDGDIEEDTELAKPEKDESDHSNPMSHSVADIADAAAEIRWRRQTASETVAARCEVGLGLLNEVTESDEYLEAIKKRMLVRNATARQTLRWIQKYEDIETKLAERMAITSDKIINLINEVVAELNPKAEEENEATLRAREEKRQARLAQKKAEEQAAAELESPA